MGVDPREACGSPRGRRSSSASRCSSVARVRASSSRLAAIESRRATDPLDRVAGVVADLADAADDARSSGSGSSAGTRSGRGRRRSRRSRGRSTIAFGLVGLVDVDQPLLERLDRAPQPLAQDLQVSCSSSSWACASSSSAWTAASRLRSAATSPVSWSICSLNSSISRRQQLAACPGLVELGLLLVEARLEVGGRRRSTQREGADQQREERGEEDGACGTTALLVSWGGAAMGLRKSRQCSTAKPIMSVC